MTLAGSIPRQNFTMNYVKSLAKQLGPKGIRVNGVAPAMISGWDRELDAIAGAARSS